MVGFYSRVSEKGFYFLENKNHSKSVCKISLGNFPELLSISLYHSNLIAHEYVTSATPIVAIDTSPEGLLKLSLKEANMFLYRLSYHSR